MRSLSLNLILVGLLLLPMAVLAQQGAENTYDIALRDYTSAKNQWVKDRDIARSSQDEKDQTDAINSAKAFLDQALTTIEAYLAFAEERLDNIPSSEASNDLAQTINEAKSWATEKNSELSQRESKDGLENLSAAITDEWSDKKSEIENSLGRLTDTQLNKAVSRALAILEAYSKVTDDKDTITSLKTILENLSKSISAENIVDLRAVLNTMAKITVSAPPTASPPHSPTASPLQ